jgi:hypothetical protein
MTDEQKNTEVEGQAAGYRGRNAGTPDNVEGQGWRYGRTDEAEPNDPENEVEGQSISSGR